VLWVALVCGCEEDDDEPTVDLGMPSQSLGPDVPAYEYARDIRLVRLTATQGIQVDLVRDGIEVAPEDQIVRLVSRRRMLLRGFWTLHAGFEPRDLIGRLVVDYPDDTQIVQDFPLRVEGESSDGRALSTFQWLLEPRDVVPGMRYRAKILDPAATPVGDSVSEPPPIAPLSGSGEIALHDVQLELRIVLVPVNHRFEDCEAKAEPTAEDLEILRQAAAQKNPVQSVEIKVRDPIVFTESIGTRETFGRVLAELSRTRASDNPDPNVFYYGLVASCDGFPSTLGGQAVSVAGPPTRENGQERVSAGRWVGSGMFARETMVHEIGHSQGRAHVRCSGGEAGIDLNYPHSLGLIGAWGFGIHDFQLRSPTGARDYMSYCSNEWVSDYGWELSVDVLETLTSFDYASATGAGGHPVLAGIIDDDGEAEWWMQRGNPPEVVGGWIEGRVGPRTVRQSARVRPFPDGGEARYIEVPWTDELAAASELRFTSEQWPRGIDVHIEASSPTVALPSSGALRRGL